LNQTGSSELAAGGLIAGLALAFVALMLQQWTRRRNVAALQSDSAVVHLAECRWCGVLVAAACIGLTLPFMLWAVRICPCDGLALKLRDTLLMLTGLLPLYAGFVLWQCRRWRPIIIDHTGIACPDAWEPGLHWTDIAGIRRLDAGRVAVLVFELRAPVPVRVNRTWPSGARLAEDGQALYVQANAMRAPIEALLSAFQKRLSNHDP
jgi:hypothetical protein